MEGIRFGGRFVNIRNVVDMVLKADSEEKLQSPVNWLHEDSSEKCLANNKNRTEEM